ncbi:hypothetical protein CEXT_164721 [Caerostris extrusa]|uniref:Uncharacterized protein n=1 Tax=Caerostris extrusa TaxID=172846 RepID=A0AAV4T4S1_CAEEX|nr:hypothetical protein CEXT_164721 [Caerostris extrusa]
MYTDIFSVIVGVSKTTCDTYPTFARYSIFILHIIYVFHATSRLEITRQRLVYEHIQPLYFFLSLKKRLSDLFIYHIGIEVFDSSFLVEDQKPHEVRKPKM